MRNELGAGFHFYQPPRSVRLPSGDKLEVFPEVDEMIYRQVYEPLLINWSLDGVAFSIYASLRSYIRDKHPQAFSLMKERLNRLPNKNFWVLGDPLMHIILPLMEEDDIDILLSAGRIAMKEDLGLTPLGLWLPECAVSIPVMQSAFNHGYRFVFLRDSQIENVHGNPVNIKLPQGEMAVFVGERDLSGSVAHNPGATIDAWGFLQMISDWRRDVFFSVDGETFGHHKRDRDKWVKTVFRRDHMQRKNLLPFDIAERMSRRKAEARLVEWTSWSCEHGVKRWTGECNCDHPTANDLRIKRQLFMDLLDRKRRIKMKLDEVNKGWRKWMPQFLAVNRPYFFGERGAVNQLKFLDVSSTEKKLVEAYQMSLVGWTSCALFFGGIDRPEREYAKAAKREIDKIL